METEEIKINYGGKELLYKTFQNCAMALKGDMFNLLIETTSNIIKNIIIQGDRKIEDEIYDKIIDKFINYDEFICIEIIKTVYNFLLKYKEFHKYISVLSEEEISVPSISPLIILRLCSTPIMSLYLRNSDSVIDG